jgi:ATP-dependent DNA helicase RecG
MNGVTHEDKTVISLSVISYPIKPISFKGKYYKRVHNANHLMDLNEIANEHLRTINLSCFNIQRGWNY